MEIRGESKYFLKKMIVMREKRANAIQLFYDPVNQKWMKERGIYLTKQIFHFCLTLELELLKWKISKKESEQLLSEIKAKFQIPDGIDFKASPYEDSALIGQGQFGKVWRSSLKGGVGRGEVRVYAIKKLPWDPSDVDQISEILIQRRLKHAHVLSVHEVFSAPSMVLYIVMELCDSDLEKYLVDPARVFALFNLGDSNNSNKNKTFTTRNNTNDASLGGVSSAQSGRQKVARTLFPMLVEAVRYVHAEKVIHRDIKPANIVLRFSSVGANASACGVVPLLADFGLAKYLTTVSQRAKSYKFSPFWSAPELWSPLGGVVAEGYTKAVDVWSLGIVLLQMWMGLDSDDDTIQMKVCWRMLVNWFFVGFFFSWWIQIVLFPFFFLFYISYNRY
jgi:serine/threonine protein kinase